MASFTLSGATTSGCDSTAVFSAVTYNSYLRYFLDGSSSHFATSIVINANTSAPLEKWLAMSSGSHTVVCKRFRSSDNTEVGTVGSDSITIPKPTLATPAVQTGSTVKGTNFITLKIYSANATHYYIDCFYGGAIINYQDNTSGTFTFSGLQPGKTYTFEYYATASKYNDSPTGSASATTNSMPVLAYPTLTNITADDKKVYFTLNPVTGAADYYVSIYKVGYPSEAVNFMWVTYTGSMSMDGLTAGTDYYMYTKCIGDDYQDSPTSPAYSISTTSLPKPVNPTGGVFASSKGATYLNVYWGSLTYATSYRLQYKRNVDSTWITAVTTSSTSYSLSSLSANTKYDLRYCGINQYGESSYSPVNSATTQLYGFDWTYSKTSGGDFNVTPTEWLNFIDTIDETRRAHLLSDYQFTRTSSYFQKGQPFYAFMFTQAANAIYDIKGNLGGVNSACRFVEAGDEIYATYFENLKVALNNCISAL